MDYYISKLPFDVGREILSFLVPESKYIKFYKCSTNSHSNSSYSSRYEKAYISEKILKNKDGLYLSRIWKKNKKHRYYITEEIVDTIHAEYNDHLCAIYYYDYSSRYVGKDLDNAIVSLLLL